jgi:hypothetical protein
LAQVDLPLVQSIQVPVTGSELKAQVKLYLPPGPTACSYVHVYTRRRLGTKLYLKRDKTRVPGWTDF